MAKRIFVGGLSFDTTSIELEDAFAAIGPVKSAEVVTDRDSGRSRGFGFVEMENDADADAAIKRVAARASPVKSIVELFILDMVLILLFKLLTFLS